MKSTKTDLIEDLGSVGDFRAVRVRDRQSGEECIGINEYGTDANGNYRRTGEGITIPSAIAGELLDLLTSRAIGEEVPL